MSAKAAKETMTAAEFRALLKHLELTQNEAAKKLGFSRMTVNDWCTGRRDIRPCNASHIRRILLNVGG